MSSLRTLTDSRDPASPAFGNAEALPLPLTSFIGRDPETSALLALVTGRNERMVTVTGPGGIGKTRLAIRVAHKAGQRFRDGVVFVALADVRDPNLAPTAIAHALGIHDAIGKVLVDRIRDAHHDTNLLLVVDNLEHLVGATPMLSEILAQCPGITMLATSRRRLGLSGEQVFALQPLDPAHASELFEERAHAIAPDFVFTAESRADVIMVCGHLDGLPLAIELAAARVPILPPKAMRAWLGDRMSLLSDGRRDAPDRHRGMREAIAWSYDLLDLPGQTLLRRLAVFDGGFNLDGAAAVTGYGQAVLDSISGLEAGSLLKVMPDRCGTPRYFMLGTIREFALERLRAEGEEQDARQSHAAYVTRVADGTGHIWWTSGGLDRLDELEPELPNIRAALAWLQQAGDVPALLRLAGSLAPMWATRGYSREGRAWLEWGLARSNGTPTPSLTVALRTLSWILNEHGDHYRALVIAQQALSVAEAAGDIRDDNVVRSYLLSAIAISRMGDSSQAIAWLHKILDVLTRCANEPWAPVSRCVTMSALGRMLLELGDIDQAEEWYTKALELQTAEHLRFTPGGHAVRGLGDTARARGDHAKAMDHFRVALRYTCEVHEVRYIAHLFGAIAGAFSAMGHYEAAGRLFGASEALHERIGSPFVTATFAFQRAVGLPEPWTSMHPDCHVAEELRRTLMARTAPLRAVTLDADLAQAWWDEGRGLDLDAALDLVDAVHPGPIPRRERPGGLSLREVDVLRLLAQGHADREIGAALSISTRTVENHVHHIYGKIAVSSRAAATNWAFRHGLA